AQIGSWEDFADNIPVRPYEEFEPWIEQIAGGAKNVLTAEPVKLLEPSSGSSGAEKWIPYTRGLQAEFRRAVAVWISSVFLEMPALRAGRAYWSLTPPAQRDRPQESSVPIGFDEDSAYLGGLAQRLVNLTLATPPQLRGVTDMDMFWRLTLLSLLRCRDLRLISVWHPSFVLLLLRYLRNNWSSLLDDLASGLSTPTIRIARDTPRSRELARLGPDNAGSVWPNLAMISCWGDAHAANYLPDLRAEFPGVSLQPKGIVATEAFITLPFAHHHPLAIRSHFFEFQDKAGNILPAWSLEEKCTYTLIVTTGGGLYRYALRDQVEVTGFHADIPSLRFIGKADNVSDHYGEKLNEAFVATCLDRIFARFGLKPRFAMLALDADGTPPRYSLYVESTAELPAQLADALEEQLRESHHYDLCIRLGQLRPVGVTRITGDAYDIYTRTLVEHGMRLGDIKPTPLGRRSDWSIYF
ncbi:MAG: GH3 auxin-responsive promoter family protein, partial [Gammaproteobacteria bacterium]|nr:GH3 auxin-responsive promoter family protein [Gammaproteobacteria bacterium]